MPKASLNVTGANGQAKLEPIAMHKPPQEIFARYRELGPGVVGYISIGTGLTCRKIFISATTAGDQPTTVGNIRMSETGTLFFSPSIPGTKVPVVLEAPAHPSTKVADSVRGSRTSEPPRCRCWSRLPHIRATKVPMVVEAPAHPSTKADAHPSTKVSMLLEAPAHPSTKVPMLLEAPAHPSHQGADGGRASRTSKHQGADGARGPHTSEPPRCRCCHVLWHDQGHKVLEALVPKGEGPGKLTVSFFICRDGSPECHRMDRWSTAGMDHRSTAGNLTGGGGAPTSGHEMGMGSDIHVSETGTLFLARRSRTNRGPTLNLVLEASAHPSTKVPVVLEPLAHPSTKVADSGQGSRTSEHEGADGARGSRISEPPRCRRLLLQKGNDRDDSFIVGYPNSTLGLGRDRDGSFILLGTDHVTIFEF
ncbi:hypothetical protein GOBAR_DD36810 [Gossypium barbadense]|nr:hypothetical protein GOBAR_DD36810 [Gossypium barbadense]